MKDKKNKKLDSVIKTYIESKKEIPSDILGSYTGMTLKDEKPVQDADDL